jgi:hypothetical protein
MNSVDRTAILLSFLELHLFKQYILINLSRELRSCDWHINYLFLGIFSQQIDFIDLLVIELICRKPIIVIVLIRIKVFTCIFSKDNFLRVILLLCFLVDHWHSSESVKSNHMRKRKSFTEEKHSYIIFFILFLVL